LHKILKSFYAVLLLVCAINTSYAASCPDIQTAINEVAQLTTVSAPVQVTGGFLYTGTVALNSAIIKYYTQTKPTQVDPITQIKSLAPAFTAGTLVPTTANDDTVTCVYLGSMKTATTPDFTAPWNQVIVFQISGSVPPPPPPPGQNVQVSTSVNGLPTGASVPVTLKNSDGSVQVGHNVTEGTQFFATIPTGTYTVTATDFQDYSASIPVNPVTISATTTIAINYSKKVPPGPIGGQIIYRFLSFFPYKPSSQETMPLDDVHQDLVIANFVAGAVYAHLLTSDYPTLNFDKGYLEGSLFAQLLQESGADTYPAAKASGGSYIDQPADKWTLKGQGGGPYQINNYAIRGYWGGLGPINFVAIQKNLGYTIASQDDGSQGNKDAPLSLDNKYFGPIVAAYYQYNDLKQLMYYKRSGESGSAAWATCWVNLTAGALSLPIFDLIQNAGYNSGTTNTLINTFINICANPNDGSGQRTLAYKSMDDYTLTQVQYYANLGNIQTDPTYAVYPRQIRFYTDELYNDQARMPPGTLTLNNSMPVPIAMLRTIFENSMGTLAYVNTNNVYGYIATSDADIAFDAAIATQQLTTASVLNLSVPSDRAQLFALLDQALKNLETNLKFKFTATTEKDLWK
jgi:hypothetical protein